MAKRKRHSKKKAPKQRRPKPQSEPLPPIPDRRAMEGIMRQMVPELGSAGTPLDAAQEIMYQAFEADSPRRQVALARKAIQTCPDCADAYVLLAEHAESLPAALDLYEQGVAAGERALGKEGFREYEGHFWGFLETRPYMRARQGLADCLRASGRREEAVGHYQEMLRLNPNDNQGIRYLLASALLELEEHAELERLLQQYEDDGSAEWAYARALLAFRQEGDSQRARQALREAKKTNKHVPAYLTGSKPLPRELPQYVTMGGEDEAVAYVAQFLPAWKNTPGATAWLRNTLKVASPRSSAPRKPDWRQVKSLLIALPQVEGEVWQVDVRSLPTPIDGVGKQVNPWMLLVTNATEDVILVFEYLGKRPGTKEVWEHLLATMRNPKEEACRLWLETWHAILDIIDRAEMVSLDEFDDHFRGASFFRKGRRLLSHGRGGRTAPAPAGDGPAEDVPHGMAVEAEARSAHRRTSAPGVRRCAIPFPGLGPS